MEVTLAKHPHEVELEKADLLEAQINAFRNKLRKSHLDNIKTQKEYNYIAGIIYSDLFSESEKLGDYVYNVCEAFCEIED